MEISIIGQSNPYMFYDEKNNNLHLTQKQGEQLYQYFGVQNVEFSYELINYLMFISDKKTKKIDDAKFTATIDEIRLDKNPLEKITFEMVSMKDAQEQSKIEINSIKNVRDIKTGEKCPKCGRQAVIRMQIQARSRDEAFSYKRSCLSCEYSSVHE